MKKYFILFLLLLILENCLTTNKKEEKPDDIELWLLNAQDLTNKGKYNDAIVLLNEAMLKFPDIEVLAINYNIGFNYYKLKNIDESKKYLNRVLSIFENSDLTQEEISENRKYTILAGVILDRINQDIEDRKDPYHVKEDIKDRKRIRPKKKIEEE